VKLNLRIAIILCIFSRDRYHSNSHVLQDGESVRVKVIQVGSMLSTGRPWRWNHPHVVMRRMIWKSKHAREVQHKSQYQVWSPRGLTQEGDGTSVCASSPWPTQG